MTEILFKTYLLGAIIYFALQILAGNCHGVGNLTVKWLGNRTWRIPSILAVIPMVILWFIVLPLQIHQHNAERRRSREWYPGRDF